ncbi:MAG: hypothetical protein LBQ02_02255 [Candidatus Nomurabacteria bacterium]|jgi:hypothetical protein|nr:hypothetical protein [Candidatus Nomurabacteria bacterium]
MSLRTKGLLLGLAVVVCGLLGLGSGTVYADAPAQNVQRYEIIINADPNVPPANNIQRYNIIIKTPVYLTLSTSNVNLTAVPGSIVSDYTEVMVETTATGYTLSMAPYTDSSNSLVCGGYTIPSTNNATDGNTLKTNTWGFSYTASTDTPSENAWYPIPSTVAGATILENKSNVAAPIEDVAYLHFGVKTNYAQPPCANYTNTMVLTGEANE